MVDLTASGPGPATTDPGPAAGDTKNWAWAATETCTECGFEPAAIVDRSIADVLRASTSRWQAVLDRPESRTRPAPGVWSPVEYACHVRDVHRVFTRRVALMLAEAAPRFANWDQDEAAVVGRYWAANPARVAVELAAAGEESANGYDVVPDGGWQRTGVRGDGGEFTVSSIGHYHLHDVMHHLHDVRG